jgi:nitroreductase
MHLDTDPDATDATRPAVRAGVSDDLDREPEPDPDARAVLAALAGRRSVARVDAGAPAPMAEIARALDAAVLAPNHRLTQPWRFTVVSGEARARVGRAQAAEAVASGRLDAGRAPFEAAKWLRAPAVVVVSHLPAVDPLTAREDLLALGAAVENLLLALAAQGLGAMWRTGAAADSAAVREALGLAPAEAIVACVYVGRPLGDPLPPRRRVPAAERTRWLSV